MIAGLGIAFARPGFLQLGPNGGFETEKPVLIQQISCLENDVPPAYLVSLGARLTDGAGAPFGMYFTPAYVTTAGGTIRLSLFVGAAYVYDDNNGLATGPLPHDWWLMPGEALQVFAPGIVRVRILTPLT